ncbi:MAG TPA: MFS transporter [Actinomycetaceae bacterium]|nr:MFS transporter [Actinomycetaceae bacterium]
MAISAVNVALPSIQIGLGASDTDIQWVLAGYALAFGVVLVPGGRMGDVLGRGTLFVIGLVIFTLSSVLAGLAPDALWLNIARLFMGLGAGLNSPQVNGMILTYFQGEERAKAFAMMGVVVSGSVALGPLLTGVIIEIFGAATGWRAAFLLNGVLGIFAVWAAFIWMPFSTERRRRAQRAAGPTVRQPVDLDPVGALMLVIAILCIMMPFMLKTWWGWLLLPAGVVVLVSWVAWERRYAKRGRAPMVDMKLFGYRNFTIQTAITGTMFIGTTSIFAILALFLQGGLGASALDTSLVSLPEAILSGVFAMWAGGKVMRHGRSLIVSAIAVFMVAIVLTVGTAWLIEIFGISYWWLILPLSVMGFGHGAMGSPNQTIAVLDIPVEDGGVAGGVKQTAERIGNALGNAMMTAIYFAFVTVGPTIALTISYGVITAIVAISLVISIVDRKQQGPAAMEPIKGPFAK